EPRYGVTSLADLRRPARMPEVDAALRRAFGPLFGATATRNGEPAELAAAGAQAPAG
ncbi:MAG TPA: lipoate-protein ligase B, partial [Xanthobacteraceae bacterium]|nr:lipoate-protein ligase B [Xanthobacteraceae bacterium]